MGGGYYVAVLSHRMTDDDAIVAVSGKNVTIVDPPPAGNFSWRVFEDTTFTHYPKDETTIQGDDTDFTVFKDFLAQCDVIMLFSDGVSAFNGEITVSYAPSPSGNYAYASSVNLLVKKKW